jgi:toxin YoeB
LEHLIEWAKTDTKMLKKIFSLIEQMQTDPFNGLGKPEPLKHQFQGLWSRRITDYHRLIYQVEQDELIILSCYSHYE